MRGRHLRDLLGRSRRDDLTAAVATFRSEIDHPICCLDHVEVVLDHDDRVAVVIEHNLDVIKTADWVVDLGPEGGDRGGQIIATGTPEQIAKVPTSHTGRFLSRILETTGKKKKAA